MEMGFLLLRILLAGIFALAGFAKFADLKGSEKAFREFGVPAALALPGSIALSLAEIAIAVFLLSTDTSWHASIAASGLLLLFILQMIYQLARGNAPDCHCFGQVHSEPVGAKSVVRNLVFFALSSTLVVRGTSAQGASFSTLSNDAMMQLILGVAIAVLLAAIVFYLKSISAKQTEIIKRLEVMELVAREGGAVERDDVVHPHEGLPIGAMFPDFKLPDMAGTDVTLDGLLVQKHPTPILFFFVSPTCGPCKTLVPEFEAWKKDLDGKVRTIFISNGTQLENISKFGSDLTGVMLLQKGRELADAAKTQWTPTAVLIDAGGRVASHTAAGDTAIRDLVENVKGETFDEKKFTYITNGHGNAHNSKLGRTIPEFALADQTGTKISQDNLKGRKTLVAFWSTDCMHCANMIEDLRNWDGARGQDEPDLIVFSDGTPEKLGEFGLRSPVILDEGHKTAAGFGMYGTPSAVLVNEEGVIVSETAIGAPDIWALVGKRR
jgi:peroxiredoxin